MIERIGVVGAGVMGSGIAQMFAEQGRTVLLWDVDSARLEHGLEQIRVRLKRSVEKGKKTAVEVDRIFGCITPATALHSFGQVQLAVEAVTENLKIKQQVLAELSAAIPGSATAASNTSSLSIEELSGSVTGPERFLGLHFFNPPTRLELVEVVPAAQTSPEVLRKAREILCACGKTPVTVKDTPGFIVNRLLLLMINEAARMLDEGVAAAEDIDAAMRLGALHPVGPLALADLIGLDTCTSILNVLHNKLQESSYEPARSLQSRVAEGRLGRKSGRGFFAEQAGG